MVRILALQLSGTNGLAAMFASRHLDVSPEVRPEGQFLLGWPCTMRPEMITQIVWKQFFRVANVRVIRTLLPRQCLCVISAFTESTLWRRPNYTKQIPAQKAPCNRCLARLGNHSRKIKMCVWAFSAPQ